ncbi:MAG: sigma-70 family RNA polymerase sigma factor [Pirellulaceae bacterium]
MQDPSQQLEDLSRVHAGDQRTWEAVWEENRDRLRRFVQIRMHRRLAGRVDPSDIIQEAYLEASRTLASYLQDPPLPLFLWLRHITGRKLTDAHRKHLGAQMRDVTREVSLWQGGPGATSESLASQLVGKLTAPSQAVMQAELQLRVQAALESLEPIDREILALRHFEQLSNAEAAGILELKESTASKRYVRALERLHDLLGDWQSWVATT